MTGKSNVVVTGGAGFIGSHIVDQLIRRGIDTYVVDDLSNGTMENLEQHRNNKLLHVRLGDIKNIGKLLSDVSDVDTVFHEAAIASVPRSIAEPMVVHDVNLNSSVGVLDYCIKKNVRRLVFASTSAVYGIVKVPPAFEGLRCTPGSPYGASKLAVEDYLSAYHNSYGLETVALRYFNVFGPRQKMSDYSGVITIFINRLLNGERPTIYGDGHQTRDFVHVEDIVQANMLAMESDNAVGESFNVASGDQVSILQLYEIIKDITKADDVVPEFAPPRAGDVQGTAVSIEKIQGELGYEPKVRFEEGLDELVYSMKTKMELQPVRQSSQKASELEQ